MNKELSLILLNKIKDAPYLSRTSGLVQVFDSVIETGAGTFVTKRIPVTPFASWQDCTTQQPTDMVPNSACKGMAYFEDGGITNPVKARSGWQYTSHLRLVCWLNTTLITGSSDMLLTAKAVTDIVNRLSGNPFNSGPFTRIAISVANIPMQDKTIFAKYDYAESELQYLMAPYEYFALDLNVTYVVPFGCADELIAIN